MRLLGETLENDGVEAERNLLRWLLEPGQRQRLAVHVLREKPHRVFRVEGDAALRKAINTDFDGLQGSFTKALDDRFGAMRRVKIRFPGHGEKTFVADKVKLRVVGRKKAE